MLWNIDKRPTVREACEHPYIKESIEFGKEDQIYASTRLKQLIQDLKKT